MASDGLARAGQRQLAEGWYYTDAIGDVAAGFIREHATAHADQPLFLYAAFTAPHWPLHAPAEDIEAQGERYAEGWDRIRSRRIARQVWLGPTTRDGRPVRRGNRPDIVPGDDTTYASYGIGWANVSNAPFRESKHWVHEGGIATPFIAHWPGGDAPAGAIRHQPFQLPDVMATILEATGARHPHDAGESSRRPRGTSMLPCWREGVEPEHDLFWEHEAMPRSDGGAGSWSGSSPGRGSSTTWRGSC